MNKVKAIVLAGGKGTRMKSNLPKVLHKVYDRCIIDYVCDACEDADIDDIYVIVGHKHEDVERQCNMYLPRTTIRYWTCCNASKRLYK